LKERIRIDKIEKSRAGIKLVHCYFDPGPEIAKKAKIQLDKADVRAM
jgi:hypothetical protein